MDNKEVIKKFINAVFAPRKGGLIDENGYTDIRNYFPFYKFNFDWLNYIKYNGTYRKFESNGHPIPEPEIIKKLYEKLTGLSKESYEYLFETEPDECFKLLAEKKNSDGYQGTGKDPDSMKIVKAILGVIHEDIIDYNCNDYSGDTMNSLRSVVGKLHYKNQMQYLGKRYEYIFMYDQIDYFERVGNGKIKEVKHTNYLAKDFFNQYHTLGNFVLTPKAKDTNNGNRVNVNTLRGNPKGMKDNYYLFVDYLEKLKDNRGDRLYSEITDKYNNFYCRYYDTKWEEFNRKKYCDNLIIPDKWCNFHKDIHTKALDGSLSAIREYFLLSELIISERCGEMILRLFDKLNS